MPPKTLLEDFDEQLPEPEYTKGSVSNQSKCSSTTINEEDVPDTFITEDVSVYTILAEAFLKQNANSLAGIANTLPEPGMTLQTEDDVKAHSRNILLRPVIHAVNLDSRYSGKVRIQGERHVEGLRPDISIIYTPEGNKRIAILLEYKQARYIRASQFKAIMYDKADVNPKTFEPYEFDSDKEIDDFHSATMQLKQVKAYARLGNCRYGAIFDYYILILIKFGPDYVHHAHVTIVEHDFRKATLGFLLAALQDT